MLALLPWSAVLSLCIWLYLFLAHGRFWSSSPELRAAVPTENPDVDILVPARNEAATIARVVESLLAQDYAGKFCIILVDDNSSDDTARLARAAHAGATRMGATLRDTAPNLLLVSGEPKPPGWSGKLWALSQGIAVSRAPVLLFVDADIVHRPQHLATLVARLMVPRVDLVSEMVELNCTSLAERTLVPAFVYFFQMLYPFSQVNDPACKVAAAAGGTVMIRREALERIGGIVSIKGALIDDVTLAAAVKRGGPVYLGHSSLAVSIRPYPGFADIWAMISRTAFTQLHHSAALLALTLAGLALVWWVPLATALFGHGWQRLCGFAAYALGAISFLPTLARYRRNRCWSLALPGIALFYMSATLGSAVTYWRGRGAHWKGRDYGAQR